jgi:hypothetical protein
MANGSHEKNLAQSETLRTWRSSLRGTWEVSPVPGLVPGRLGKANAVRRGMYADEKSDEAIVLWKRSNKGRQLPAEVVEGRASPKGKQSSDGRGSDTEPSCHVDPIGGCAPGRERVHTVCLPAFDPREEPGALAAHAGICAGGEEQSSSLPRP